MTSAVHFYLVIIVINKHLLSAVEALQSGVTQRDYTILAQWLSQF